MGGGWGGKRVTSQVANQGVSFNVLTPCGCTFSVASAMDRIGEWEGGTKYKSQVSEISENQRDLVWHGLSLNYSHCHSLRAAFAPPSTGHSLFGRLLYVHLLSHWLHYNPSTWWVLSECPSQIQWQEGTRATERKWTRHLILKNHWSSEKHKKDNQRETPG